MLFPSLGCGGRLQKHLGSRGPVLLLFFSSLHYIFIHLTFCTRSFAFFLDCPPKSFALHSFDSYSEIILCRNTFRTVRLSLTTPLRSLFHPLFSRTARAAPSVDMAS